MSTHINTGWHRFRETADGDDQCTICDVVVSVDAHMSFTLSCPSTDCPSKSNPDRGCVFVPSRAEVAACVYCGRLGARDGDGTPYDAAYEAMIEAFLDVD